MSATDAKPLVKVSHLKKHFRIKEGFAKPKILRAVDGVSFDIYEGETLGLLVNQVVESRRLEETSCDCRSRRKEP